MVLFSCSPSYATPEIYTFRLSQSIIFDKPLTIRRSSSAMTNFHISYNSFQTGSRNVTLVPSPGALCTVNPYSGPQFSLIRS